ncbi:SAM-dependent methyltransferase [Microbispora rosea]|uniref:SAM-dependent methyltransferase n=1 Tax=Microbispora rosea TaxID=58117 RepID=UPI0004C42ABE|nr:SAM-dependent methyltransferase [Microbispora rosea]
MPGFSPVEPVGFDPSVPNEARVYDYWLGGKDNFAADREAAEAALLIAPELPLMCREGRKFLRRTVRFLAAAGIRQFIDIGCGLPTQGNVHEIARECAPDARVVYVDNDPVVVNHGQALVEENERVVVIHGDVRDPDAILTHPRLRELVDLDEPVGVLLVSVLEAINDDDLTTAITARLREAIAPGSYMVISHAISDLRPEVTDKLALLFAGEWAVKDDGRLRLPTRAEILPLFGDLEMVEPGLVQVPEWRPEPGELRPQKDTVWSVGGVGRKRRPEASGL